MEHVIVGLSGGVDSAVAAALLVEQGYSTEGLFMKNWEEDSEYCTSEKDYKDALQVCDSLGIPLRSVNFSMEYWDKVFKHFLDEYRAGRTPNPDILCNTEIKFKAFLDYAIELGADKIATGHYARITENQGQYQLRTGLDDSKDQSYFLHLLDQEQLSQSLFPLGEIDKTRVREIATKNGFVTAEKKDSTGICFIGERNFSDFLNDFLPKEQGDIVDENGRFIKHHHGIPFYTVGQRKGLEIGGGFSDSPEPWFVAEKRIDNNEIVVVQGDHPLLYHNTLIAEDIHWIGRKPCFPHHCSAKIRYRQASQNCQIEIIGNGEIKVRFDSSQRAITEGQSLVLYDQDICIGGGAIKSKHNE